jgi:hypothetical protein
MEWAWKESVIPRHWLTARMKEHQIVKAMKRFAIFGVSSVSQHFSVPLARSSLHQCASYLYEERGSDGAFRIIFSFEAMAMANKRAYLLYRSFVYAGSVFVALVIPAAFKRRRKEHVLSASDEPDYRNRHQRSFHLDL